MLTEMYSRLYDNSFLTREFAFFPKFEGVYLDDPKELKFEFYRRPWNSFQRRRIQHGSHELFEEFAENLGPQKFENFESDVYQKKVSQIAENITEKINTKTERVNEDVFADITEKVDFLANLVAMKNQKLLEILVRSTYAIQLIIFSILSFFFCPFKTILKKLSASLKAIAAIADGGKTKRKLQKTMPTKIQKDPTIKVQPEPEPEKKSSSLEEPQNCDFWWDTVSLDLSFQPKSEMIDSGIFEPELEQEVQLLEEKVETVLEQKGSDVTVLTSSETIDLAIKAADVILERHKLECDVISLGKMDASAMEMILASLKKTRHLVIIENEWSNTGEEVFMAIRECEGYSFYSERKTGYGRIIKVKL